MEFIRLKTGKDDEGRRLDRIAKKLLSEENLSQLYKALRNGLIKVNEKKQKGEYRIQKGDEIKIASFLAETALLTDKKNQKKITSLPEGWIVLRTQELLFLNKPYDLPVQKSKAGELALNVFVQEDYDFFNSKNAQKSLSFRTGPLHRLDRRTTGLIAFSQNLEGAQEFSKAIQEHKIKKTYIAIIEGALGKTEIWTEKISRNEKDLNSSKFHTVSVNSDSKNSKESYTTVIPVAYGEYKGIQVTFVKFVISTGRTHQIRATSAYHAHPLLGDTVYGAKQISEKQNLFLHSYSLEFQENLFNLPKKIVCPPGENFVSVLKSSLINLPCEL
ncbi:MULTISPECIES: RluA family pseudouridine synthase [unclassified Treponema]|uniref:RluA family pseudouridine synthase n=1 Tax=unclassified Treponema TaxID=2638727 RepID=UPI0025E613BA|nr:MULTISPECIES: RluA family pseudouridine synthase [unclassified Treponema]